MPFTARADMAIGKFIKIQIRKKLFKLNIMPTFNKLKFVAHLLYFTKLRRHSHHYYCQSK